MLYILTYFSDTHNGGSYCDTRIARDKTDVTDTITSRLESIMRTHDEITELDVSEMSGLLYRSKDYHYEKDELFIQARPLGFSYTYDVYDRIELTCLRIDKDGNQIC